MATKTPVRVDVFGMDYTKTPPNYRISIQSPLLPSPHYPDTRRDHGEWARLARYLADTYRGLLLPTLPAAPSPHTLSLIRTHHTKQDTSLTEQIEIDAAKEEERLSREELAQWLRVLLEREELSQDQRVVEFCSSDRLFVPPLPPPLVLQKRHPSTGKSLLGKSTASFSLLSSLRDSVLPLFTPTSLPARSTTTTTTTTLSTTLSTPGSMADIAFSVAKTRYIALDQACVLAEKAIHNLIKSRRGLAVQESTLAAQFTQLAMHESNPLLKQYFFFFFFLIHLFILCIDP